MAQFIMCLLFKFHHDMSIITEVIQQNANNTYADSHTKFALYPKENMLL